VDLGIYVERAGDRSFGDGNILALIPKAAKRLRMKSIEVTKEWSGTSVGPSPPVRMPRPTNPAAAVN
jgi:hypothetical protein